MGSSLRMRPFWIYTTISFFKAFSPLPMCVLKILSIFYPKKKKVYACIKIKQNYQQDIHDKFEDLFITIKHKFLYFAHTKKMCIHNKLNS